MSYVEAFIEPWPTPKGTIDEHKLPPNSEGFLLGNLHSSRYFIFTTFQHLERVVLLVLLSSRLEGRMWKWFPFPCGCNRLDGRWTSKPCEHCLVWWRNLHHAESVGWVRMFVIAISCYSRASVSYLWWSASWPWLLLQLPVGDQAAAS